jgi:hypothetical protein
MTSPLRIPADALARGTSIRLAVVPDRAALTAAFAEALLAEYLAARQAGRATAASRWPIC